MERIENLEIDLHKYAQLIFDKGVKAFQWKKDQLLTTGAGASGYP